MINYVTAINIEKPQIGAVVEQIQRPFDLISFVKIVETNVL